MVATLKFSATLSKSDPQTNPVLIVGQPKNLAKITFEQVQIKLLPRVNSETFTAAVSGLHPSPTDSCSLWLNNATVAALPVKCSRHNTPSRAHSLTKILKSCLVGGEEFIVIVCEKSDVVALGCAVARALPLYSAKSSSSSDKRSVTVEYIVIGDEGNNGLTEHDLNCLSAMCHGIRLSAKIVDTPCAEMHSDALLNEVRRVGEELNIEPLIIQGAALNEKGFGGIYNVGKSSNT
ncbi:hypothetical protein KUTeg_019047 [Tegillarca granosa]|uniref:Probable aminopeptidase NPEPL1 N-terminal domain-containing protein n=1 Tax=Tegillarca granosa TaxID=220873 RepID=A0ABQ9EFM9_TEGGR|nr:hypothetical protein KUTeg_019047 [Tegillarca granosa]